jgi:cytosol alanyl aminopeptidase
MGPFGDTAVADLPYEYVKAHYDEIVPKLPTGIGIDYAAMFPLFATASACSESARNDVKAFFEPRMQKVQGGPRNLANALETIHLCASEKPAAESAITKFLGEYNRSSAPSLGHAH